MLEPERKKERRVWFIVVLLAWFAGNLGPLLTDGLMPGVAKSLGATLGCLFAAAIPAFLIKWWLLYAINRPLSSRKFTILFGFCVVVVGLLTTIGHVVSKRP